MTTFIEDDEGMSRFCADTQSLHGIHKPVPL